MAVATCITTPEEAGIGLEGDCDHPQTNVLLKWARGGAQFDL